jgi:predicted nucleotidyltransferase
MGRARINIPHNELAAFCRRNNILKLSLFGSVLRDDFGPESDIDVLVEFQKGRVPGLITLSGLELELGRIFGRKVDLRTPEDLSRYFRDEVVRTAEVQYAA